MTPLLETLQAASKAGFDAPRCKDSQCRDGYHHWLDGTHSYCSTCDGTDLDANDPERLIGRATGRLYAQNRNVLVGDGFAQSAIVDGNLWTAVVGEPHDGTTTGIATALLRLVARVGGAT